MTSLNWNVYKAIAAAGMPMPDIPVRGIEYFAQCGEDVVVLALLRALALREGLDLAEERYLEIGANHPVATSSTWLLQRAAGMTGVLVEANPRLLDALRTHRHRDHLVHAAVSTGEAETVELFVSNQSELSSLDRDFVLQWRQGAVGEREVVTVPAIRIDDLMRSHFADRAPLFLSVDIEGMDLEVLRDLDFTRFRPAVVQAEPSDHHHPGNTEAIAGFLTSAGYLVIARTEVNLIALDAARAGLGGTGMSGADPVTQALSHLQEARRDAARWKAEYAGAQADLQELATRLSAAESAGSAYRNEAVAARREADDARAAAAAAAAAAAERLAAAETALAAMHASTSWRATAPLRAVMDRLRGGRG
jgi:FkbM family methyltransferase